jgi:hypothetical protein
MVVSCLNCRSGHIIRQARHNENDYYSHSDQDFYHRSHLVIFSSFTHSYHKVRGKMTEIPPATLDKKASHEG